jgi:dipeptidyl aminopeptidase/acylaminoacyl peptidase
MIIRNALLVGLLASVSVGCMVSNEPTSKEVLAKEQTPFMSYNAETFFNTVTFRGSDFSPSGKHVLLSSDESGIFNIYELDIKTGLKKQLTDNSDSTYSVGYFPDDERVLFTKDKAGNELFHLYVREQNGEIKDLTPGDKTRAMMFGFSGDKTSFYVLTNERDMRFMDLYKYDAITYQRALLYKNEAGLNVQAISHNGRYLVLNKANSNKDSDLFLLDSTKPNEKPVLISNLDQDAVYTASAFSKDDSRLLYHTNAHGEYSQVWQYDLKTGTHSPYLSESWDIDRVYFSDSGRYRVHFVNEDSSTKLVATDLKTNNVLALPPLPDGNLLNVDFSQDEKQISFYLSSDTSPPNLYVWRFGDKVAKQLTSSLNIKINEADLVSSTIERFDSFDGVEIPGVMYRPKKASVNNKVPAIIFVHGGPGGQSRRGYNPVIQHLVNHGYAVYAINNRGSSGYGKTFFHLDDKKHGQDDLQDLIWGKKYLQSLNWVQNDRIGIMGGSYGGYLTAAALTFTPEEFKVGINIFGVTNWVRTLNSIPPWWESYRKALYDEMGDPATDGARHRAISPLFHAKNIIKPLMVVQGANDPRVLQVESDELVEAVKANGTPVEYVLFEDEGHSFTKKKNRITASNAYLDFLKTYL